MRPRFLPLLAAVVAVALAGSGCSGGGLAPASIPAPVTKETPRSGGTLDFALTHDPNGLDPTRNAWEASGIEVAFALFDTLMATADDGSVKPYLVESVTPDATYKEWDFRMRPGVTFHDGTALDADAFRLYVKAIQESLVTGQAATYVSGTDKLDDRTVRIHMLKPWAAFPAILVGQAGAVASPNQLADPLGHSHPSGTGPFKLDSWKIGEEVRLVRNDRYWRKDDKGVQLPYLDGVNFKIMTDHLSRIEALRTGKVDLTHDRDVDAVQAYKALAASGDVKLTHDQGATESLSIELNTAKPPFDDVRVRRAVSYAADVKALARENQWDPDRIADTPMAPDSPWYAPVVFPRDDLDQARALVAAYEKDNGHPVEFNLSVGVETRVGQQLVEQWARVGIKASVNQIDPKAETLLSVSGQYDALLLTYFAADDPDILWHFFHSSTIAPIGGIGLNFARLGDPEIDRAFDLGRSSANLEERKAAYATVQRRWTDLVPYVWLYRLDWVIVAGKNVRQAQNMTLPDGAPARPFTSGVFRLTETWMLPD